MISNVKRLKSSISSSFRATLKVVAIPHQPQNDICAEGRTPKSANTTTKQAAKVTEDADLDTPIDLSEIPF